MQWPRFFGSKAFVTFVVCLTIFTDVFIYGLVVPVLPYALIKRAHVPPDQLQTWNTIMMCSWAGPVVVGAVLFGWLGDHLSSHRWSFVSGQALLLFATLLFTFSKSLALFLFARIVSGLSCGAVLTVAYALLYDSVGSAGIGKAAGFTTMSLGVALFSGPIVGGFIYDNAAYEWVFAPALILVGLEIILRLCVIEPTRHHEPKAQNTERQSLLHGQSRESSSTTLDGDADHTAIDEHSSPNSPSQRSPIVILMTDPRFLVNILGFFIMNNLISSFEAILPVFAYEQMGFTSSQTSLLFLCITLPQLFASLLSGWISDRYGCKWPALAGFTLSGTAITLLELTGEKSEHRLTIMVVLLTLFGIGVGVTYPPVYAEVGHAVEDLEKRQPGVLGDRGAFTLAFGLENCAFGAGALIGPIYASPIQQRFGWSAMCVTLGVISLVMAIPVFFFTGGRVSNTSEQVQKSSDASEE